MLLRLLAPGALSVQIYEKAMYIHPMAYKKYTWSVNILHYAVYSIHGTFEGEGEGWMKLH